LDDSKAGLRISGGHKIRDGSANTFRQTSGKSLTIYHFMPSHL
jgi:hypothetical protein